MKTKDIYDDLVAIAKGAGVAIRRETGRFKSGYCTIDGKPIVILNKMASQEHHNKILANSILYFDIDVASAKQPLRDYIHTEVATQQMNLFEINIEGAKLG